jgi:hypothetical protein
MTEAVEFCDKEIDFYKRMMARNRIADTTLRIGAICLGALTPVLILVTTDKILQASVAALAAVFATLPATFGWRENYLRSAYSHELLRTEVLQFKTRTGARYRRDLGDQKALDNFVAELANVTRRDVSEWRRQMQGLAKPGHSE